MTVHVWKCRSSSNDHCSRYKFPYHRIQFTRSKEYNSKIKTQFCPKWGPNFESDGDLMVTSASRNGDGPKRVFLKIDWNKLPWKESGDLLGTQKTEKRSPWGPGSPNGDPRWSSGNYVNWHKRCPRFEDLRNVYLMYHSPSRRPPSSPPLLPTPWH